MSLGLILFLILLGIVIFVIVVYNRLVALRQICRQAWGDVDVQLKQRHDLIPNLVETVKGYASHERETLEAVVEARNSALAAGNVGEQGAAEGLLSSALGKLFALAEAYPDLKADGTFLKLQTALQDVENKIAAARRFFNNSVAEFNTAQEQFPAALFARQLGFEPRDYFELKGAERAAAVEPPKISFNE
jgi:LemA protein